MTDTNTLAPTDAEILDVGAGLGIRTRTGQGALKLSRAVLAKWGAPALASQPYAYEFSRSNGDGTHSEHIERGRLQEVAPGRWEHSGMPRGALADKPIKALYTTQQTQPVAVPASGPVGFDHKTAANFLNGKTVTDAEVRQFVAHSRWAHDDRDWLCSTLAALRREIAQRDAEIALLKTSLLDVESPTQAAQVQNAWNPIETAPKDKSNVVLLRQPCGSLANGYFLAEAHAGNGAWIWPYIHKTPTHWMPLPAPPAAIAAQKGDKP